ncbi:Tab2/Atab2 family RNA-binding protein [Nostoc sp. UCD121]|uniref:Tab2/Atab2 family RNA-binding protein n=1 Tax=unclassified Nostoc TaxID=2593658 RepID=UPI00162494AA|nr:MULTISPECIES: Tab2/Atab2 family RNA-binding protein [unclassified Nostoc]MBC1221593.1 Tab2/Atab2 family RNA-binding protein [Nostoc sp. UCD120]MBC1274598.1 Tab2/Atab2 family RNA-binding protein [Nostoc sp. UCD121]MBC1294855.1 Tab2/Atab2 family RNA-binding protein [Nostoc sp. UCD122]
MGSIWEIDFYSRPILDDNQKKIWEVLVCESPLDISTKPDSLFRYAQYCPSTQVNSGWLRTALQEAITQAGKAPIKIRFFRRQMNNMITKACQDIGIPAQPSRRTLVLNQWLEERMEEVYPQEPGYQGGTNPSVRLEKPLPQRLPDALEGQQWVFVTLDAADLAEMPEWEIGFSEAFPLELAKVSPEARIPGILIFSPRALPLAGWMSGLELAFLRFDTSEEARLLLETGVTESWIVANIKKPQVLAEAKGFEEAKQKANGVHFIGIQSDPKAESFAGFWLLQEVNL